VELCKRVCAVDKEQKSKILVISKCNYNSLLALKSSLQLDISHDCNFFLVVLCTVLKTVSKKMCSLNLCIKRFKFQFSGQVTAVFNLNANRRTMFSHFDKLFNSIHFLFFLHLMGEHCPISL